MYGMDLPTKFEEFDPWHELAKNDSLPPNIDPSTISWVCEFLLAPLTFFVSNPRTTVKSPENNASVSLDYDVQDGSDQEWVVLEAFLIRISTRHSPPGRFPVYQNITTPSGFRTTVGYDAAVCVLKYEPWVIEAYNSSTGSPSALRIVGKGDSGVSLSPSGKIRGDRIANGTRYLNTTGKDAVFNPARGNGVYQITKDDGLLAWYPTPAVGPIVPTRTIFLLTSTHSIGRFFHRWRWAQWIHRTLSRAAHRHPRTVRRGLHSAILCGVWTRRRAFVRG